jgi:hypothetical protein
VGAPSKIRVLDLSGSVTAFSRGRHERYLQSSGVRLAEAESITARSAVSSKFRKLRQIGL